MLNSFVGTLVYSCPEIIENLPYNEGADVWALGCIAYELVTLKSTFISKNPLVLAKKICSVEYEPIE
jgi:NIMA (never in mitosis gene a)-related kinase